MVLGIQFVGIFFGLFMLYITTLYSKRKEIDAKERWFWVSAWIVFILLVIFPNSVDMIARRVLNISRTLDFLIILGFMFLIGISFYNYLIIKKNQNKIEKIVRKIAVKNS